MPVDVALTTHFLDLSLVQLLANPGLTLNFLSIKLPLGQEANLYSTAFSTCPDMVSHAGFCLARSLPYQMHGIIHVFVSSELSLDILIPQNSHFAREVLPMRPQKSSVQRYRRKQVRRHGFQARCASSRG